MAVEKRDWRAWHLDYEDPNSNLSRRLRVIQGMVRSALDAAKPGPLRAIKVCAGQGRDLIGVLADHPRADDVHARLVELDPANAEFGRRLATEAGLERVEVITGDASTSSAYEGSVPADLVVACGVFGNIPDADVVRTIDFLSSMCARGATVIWTRHRKPPDLTPQIRTWFEAAGFEEIEFVAPSDSFFGVGAHRFVGEPTPFRPGERLFTFFR